MATFIVTTCPVDLSAGPDIAPPATKTKLSNVATETIEPARPCAHLAIASVKRLRPSIATGWPSRTWELSSEGATVTGRDASRSDARLSGAVRLSAAVGRII